MKPSKVSNAVGGNTFNKEKEVIRQYMDAIGKVIGNNWKSILVILLIIIFLVVPIVPVTNMTIGFSTVEELGVSSTQTGVSLYTYFLLRTYNMPSDYDKDNYILLDVNFLAVDGKVKYGNKFLLSKSEVVPRNNISFLIAESLSECELIRVATNTAKKASGINGRNC